MVHHTLETATLLAMDSIMDMTVSQPILYSLVVYNKKEDTYGLGSDPTDSLQDVLEEAEFMDGSQDHTLFCIMRLNRKTGNTSTIYNTKELRSILNDREEVRGAA